MKKIVFFQAHPDDLEFTCGHIMHYLAQKKEKYEIEIVSSTKGEFGLPGTQYDKFKGDFLAKVRTRELISAQKIHGIPAENIEWFGFIDGFVEFNKEIIDKTVNYLKKEKPDIIFAPEPIYTYYYHKDHINTGKTLFYVIYNKLIDFTPILYYYTSFQSTHKFGFKRKEIALTKQLLACHKTQFWLINYLMLPYRPGALLYARGLRGWSFAEAFRRVSFTNPKENKPKLFTRMFSHFFYSHPNWYQAKYPEAVLKDLKEKRAQSK